MASGELPPSQSIAAAFQRSPELAGRWKASAGRRLPKRWPIGAPRSAFGSSCPVIPTGRRSCSTIHGGPRSCSPRATPACSPVAGSGSSAPATRHVGVHRPPPGSATNSQRPVCALCRVLALGVDGAAHRGALAAAAAAPAAVVANGHGDPYPRRHRALWDAGRRGRGDPVRVAAGHGARIRSGFRSATGSSPRCPSWSSWSRVANAVAA